MGNGFRYDWWLGHSGLIFVSKTSPAGDISTKTLPHWFKWHVLYSYYERGDISSKRLARELYYMSESKLERMKLIATIKMMESREKNKQAK
jgi:hypothetical protein